MCTPRYPCRLFCYETATPGLKDKKCGIDILEEKDHDKDQPIQFRIRLSFFDADADPDTDTDTTRTLEPGQVITGNRRIYVYFEESALLQI
jgi:hypothetical protein